MLSIDVSCFSPNDVEMPLAKVIPIMNGLLYTVCGNTPNPIVQVSTDASTP